MNTSRPFPTGRSTRLHSAILVRAAAVLRPIAVAEFAASALAVVAACDQCAPTPTPATAITSPAADAISVPVQRAVDGAPSWSPIPHTGR